MEKKIILLLLCCMFLTGCSSDSISQEEFALIEAEEDKQKEKSDLYSTEGLETIVLEDVEFQIPKIWMESIKESGDWTYYYYNDLMLGTCLQSEYRMTNEELISNSDSLIDGILQGDGVEEIVSNEITIISGKEVIEVAFLHKINEKYYYTNALFFIHELNRYSLGWVIEKDTNTDYSDDWESFKESILISGKDNELSQNNSEETESEENINEETEPQENVSEMSESESSEPQVQEPEPEQNDSVGITMEQQNALNSAKDYLSIMAFSYQGIIEQLEYEKYSHEAAVYAADNCGADWNEQALKNAKQYLSNMAFSYNGLIEQLEYEKFTNEQAIYAADNCGADWNEQAAKSAKSYLDNMSFSKEGLIEQLEYEGFTHEQAVYGAEANGY